MHTFLYAYSVKKTNLTRNLPTVSICALQLGWKLRVAARWESRKLGLMAQSLIYGPQHLWGSAAEAKLHQAALCHTGHTKVQNCRVRISLNQEGLNRCMHTFKIMTTYLYIFNPGSVHVCRGEEVGRTANFF